MLFCLFLPIYAAAQASKAPDASPGSFLSLGNGKIYYEECGNGPQAVVLLHDGVLHSAAWGDIWPELCRRFHAIRYDRRGYGRSPASAGGYFETDDLASLLRHLKVARAAIVGSSHGGEISINFALDHPEMTQELVLVGAVVGGMPYSKHFLDRGDVLGKPLEKGDVQGAIAAAINDKYLIAAGNDAAKKRMAALLSASPQDLTHPSFEITPKPALYRLREIKVPTLLLVGDQDIPDVHAHAGAIEAGIARARRVVVSGVGHLMYLEKPAEFVQLVSGFIENAE
ncbi:MAG TPA: alpha/beta hydrolase [Candidatus Acidoferrum sp.]|nr:alpha/beta hydrolase [Candidatus Acidoferrum sp.]